MEQVFREKIMPVQWIWCVVNNLDKFNDRPVFILDLIEKMKRIKDHRLISTFQNLFERIETCYNEDGKFPDTAWLTLNFKGNMNIKIVEDEFSMQIYDSLTKYLDQEYIKQEIATRIVDVDNPKLEDIKSLTQDMIKFADTTAEMPKETKESLINSYEAYSADFLGLETHIKPVDKVIGVMGYKSLSVFAAPSGHGKSTFAISLAYYAAIHGYCVDYLSFEIPKQHVWFNIVSIESENSSHKLQASAMKENQLTEEERGYYQEHMRNFLDKTKIRNGRLDIFDQTTASINNYEALCSKLETIAEERGRKADLIIVDNIDNFQTFESPERNEVTKINNYIVSLDSFCKKYHNGDGCTILLLSQVNRPALKKLHTTEGESGNDKKVKIDVTCIQKYNALYEKATCVLVGYADEVLRAGDTMKVYPVKLRNRPIPLKPIQLNVKFGYSKVKGEFPLDEYTNPEERAQVVDDCLTGISSLSEDELDAINDDLQDIMD